MCIRDRTKGARTEVEDYYAADVEAKYGVTPAGFIELKALMGDTADNIPGVPKVGEKTASELLKQFQTLDNLYAHVEEVTKKAVRESLIANKDLAYLSLDLATIRIDSPVVLDWNEARLGELYTCLLYTSSSAALPSLLNSHSCSLHPVCMLYTLCCTASSP